MRLPRLTTRRMMVLVAVAAVGLGTFACLRRRRDSFLHEAARQKKLSDEAGLAAYLLPFRYHWPLSDPERAEADAYERLSAYHATLHAKYERAARYPWLPVSADPLPPK